MIRTVWTLALLLSVSAPDPHVRSLDADLLDAIHAGARTSGTLRGLVARIDASDVVAYVMWARSTETGVAAHVSFMAAAPERRYLRVVIDPAYGGCQLLGLIGHELQHVVEIAGERTVVDERSLAALYRTIGYESGGFGEARFESRAAIESGRRVMHEVLASGSLSIRAR